MISMTHSMGMIVVSEGIEEEEEKEQFDLLGQYSCDEIQGYLLSKPVLANEMLDLLRDPKKIIDVI